MNICNIHSYFHVKTSMTANVFKSYENILNRIRNKEKNISYEEHIQALNEIYHLNDILLFDEVFISFENACMSKTSLFSNSLDILSKGLELSSRNPNQKEPIHFKYLTLIGILCSHNNHQKDAINFYILGLLKTEDHNKYIFYSNIASSLTCTEDYDLALIFFKRALSNLEFYKERNIELYIFWKNHLTLNLAACYLELNLVRESERLLDRVEYIEELSSYYKNLYALIDFFIKYYYELNETVFKGSYRVIKEQLLKEESYTFLIKLNKFYLEKFPQTKHSFRKELLTESYKCAIHSHNNLLKKKYLLLLIDLCVQSKDSENEFIYLKALYNLDKAVQGVSQSQVTSILLSQYIDFFGKLKAINDTIIKQKNELEDITHILSHDLKTPIRSISSFINLIENESKEIESIQPYIDFCKKGISNLDHLIDDLHELNVFSNNSEHQMNVNLNTLINTVIKESGIIEKVQKAEIIIENPLPKYYCKLSDFALLFGHLIENGIKYNESKIPTVKISCSQDDQYLTILVKDNGIGIPEKYYDTIFSFFKRLHTNDVYEGTGFGLGIVKRIVKKYNGDIFVESGMHQGSCFTIELPL